MALGIFYPHPIERSLGSMRRLFEIVRYVHNNYDVDIFVYSPFETKIVKFKSFILKPIKSLFIPPFFLNHIYDVSKKIYYNKFFNKLLLMRYINNVSVVTISNMVNMLKEDNVTVLQAEHDVSIPLCVKVANRLKIPVIADLHNITSEELVASNLLFRTDQLYNSLNDTMKYYLSKCSYICVVSEYMKKYVSNKYLINENKIVVASPGLVKTSFFKGGKKHDHYQPKIVYTGMINQRENVELFVKSIPYIMKHYPKANFYLTDRGSERKPIKKLCKELSVTVNFFWFPSLNDLFSFLSLADIGVLPSANDIARRLGPPIKLMDYLSVGLPVVANDVGGWCDIFRQNKIGLLANNNPKDFAQAIIELLMDPSLSKDLSPDFYPTFFSNHSWEQTLNRLGQLYSRLLH